MKRGHCAVNQRVTSLAEAVGDRLTALPGDAVAVATLTWIGFPHRSSSYPGSEEPKPQAAAFRA